MYFRYIDPGDGAEVEQQFLVVGQHQRNDLLHLRQQHRRRLHRVMQRQRRHSRPSIYTGHGHAKLAETVFLGSVHPYLAGEHAHPMTLPIAIRRIRGLRGSEEGATAVEMAVVLFTVMVLILGMVEFAVGYFTLHSMLLAVEEVGRYVMVNNASCT